MPNWQKYVGGGSGPNWKKYSAAAPRDSFTSTAEGTDYEGNTFEGPAGATDIYHGGGTDQEKKWFREHGSRPEAAGFQEKHRRNTTGEDLAEGTIRMTGKIAGGLSGGPLGVLGGGALSEGILHGIDKYTGTDHVEDKNLTDAFVRGGKNAIPDAAMWGLAGAGGWGAGKLIPKLAESASPVVRGVGKVASQSLFGSNVGKVAGEAAGVLAGDRLTGGEMSPVEAGMMTVVPRAVIQGGKAVGRGILNEIKAGSRLHPGESGMLGEMPRGFGRRPTGDAPLTRYEPGEEALLKKLEDVPRAPPPKPLKGYDDRNTTLVKGPLPKPPAKEIEPNAGTRATLRRLRDDTASSGTRQAVEPRLSPSLEGFAKSRSAPAEAPRRPSSGGEDTRAKLPQSDPMHFMEAGIVHEKGFQPGMGGGVDVPKGPKKPKPEPPPQKVKTPKSDIEKGSMAEWEAVKTDLAEELRLAGKRSKEEYLKVLDIVRKHEATKPVRQPGEAFARDWPSEKHPSEMTPDEYAAALETMRKTPQTKENFAKPPTPEPTGDEPPLVRRGPDPLSTPPAGEPLPKTLPGKWPKDMSYEQWVEAGRPNFADAVEAAAKKRAARPAPTPKPPAPKPWDPSQPIDTLALDKQIKEKKVAAKLLRKKGQRKDADAMATEIKAMERDLRAQTKAVFQRSHEATQELLEKSRSIAAEKPAPPRGTAKKPAEAAPSSEPKFSLWFQHPKAKVAPAVEGTPPPAAPEFPLKAKAESAKNLENKGAQEQIESLTSELNTGMRSGWKTEKIQAHSKRIRELEAHRDRALKDPDADAWKKMQEGIAAAKPKATVRKGKKAGETAAEPVKPAPPSGWGKRQYREEIDGDAAVAERRRVSKEVSDKFTKENTFRDSEGNTLIIHPSSNASGTWQVTRFDAAGDPIGHVNFQNLSDARASAQGGFVEGAPPFGSKSFKPSTLEPGPEKTQAPKAEPAPETPKAEPSDAPIAPAPRPDPMGTMWQVHTWQKNSPDPHGYAVSKFDSQAQAREFADRGNASGKVYAQVRPPAYEGHLKEKSAPLPLLTKPRASVARPKASKHYDPENVPLVKGPVSGPKAAPEPVAAPKVEKPAPPKARVVKRGGGKKPPPPPPTAEAAATPELPKGSGDFPVQPGEEKFTKGHQGGLRGARHLHGELKKNPIPGYEPHEFNHPKEVKDHVQSFGGAIFKVRTIKNATPENPHGIHHETSLTTTEPKDFPGWKKPGSRAAIKEQHNLLAGFEVDANGHYVKGGTAPGGYSYKEFHLDEPVTIDGPGSKRSYVASEKYILEMIERGAQPSPDMLAFYTARETADQAGARVLRARYAKDPPVPMPEGEALERTGSRKGLSDMGKDAKKLKGLDEAPGRRPLKPAESAETKALGRLAAKPMPENVAREPRPGRVREDEPPATRKATAEAKPMPEGEAREPHEPRRASQPSEPYEPPAKKATKPAATLRSGKAIEPRDRTPARPSEPSQVKAPKLEPAEPLPENKARDTVNKPGAMGSIRKAVDLAGTGVDMLAAWRLFGLKPGRAIGLKALGSGLHKGARLFQKGPKGRVRKTQKPPRKADYPAAIRAFLLGARRKKKREALAR